MTQLPLIASAIDGMLEAAEEQYQLLQQARPKAHVLDDHTVGRYCQVIEQRAEIGEFHAILAA